MTLESLKTLNFPEQSHQHQCWFWNGKGKNRTYGDFISQLFLRVKCQAARTQVN